MGTLGQATNSTHRKGKSPHGPRIIPPRNGEESPKKARAGRASDQLQPGYRQGSNSVMVHRVHPRQVQPTLELDDQPGSHKVR
jgi:hypothetical protein